jgi:hypothetical protein
MAFGVQTSGSTALTVGTYVTLATITAAGVFQFNCDINPLSGWAEGLILRVSRKVLTAGTIRQTEEVTLGRGSDANKDAEDIPRKSHYEIKYEAKQEGGSARTIDWLVSALQ